MFRYAFIVVFAVLIATLLYCSHASMCSKKSIGKSVCLFCLSLVPPVLGNMFIIGTSTRVVALVGYYMYYIGMDIAMYALLRFTREYCHVKNAKNQKRKNS